MAEHSGTPHAGNTVAVTSNATKATPSLDPTEELTKGIKKLSTTDANDNNDDAASEELASEDDERSWSSGEVTVVDEPSTVENRRKDAIDRIMKSFCATLETKLSISAKSAEESKQEQPRPPRLSDFKSNPAQDDAKKEPFSPPAGVPKLSSFKSKPVQDNVKEQFSPPAGVPKLSSFKSKPAQDNVKKEQFSPPAGVPKLSSFKSKPAQGTPNKEQFTPPAGVPKLSSFKSKPAQGTPNKEQFTPPAGVPKLSSFKSKPAQDTSNKAPFTPPAGVPKLSSFRSKSAPGPVANESLGPPPLPSLSSFKSKPATAETEKEDPSTPPSLPKLSSFKSQPAQAAVSEEASSPPAGLPKLSSFRSKPPQPEPKNEASSSAAAPPRLSSFKSKPVAARPPSAELAMPAGLGSFMIPPIVSFPALEIPPAPPAPSAAPAAKEPDQLTKPKEEGSAPHSTISTPEATATARSASTPARVSEESGEDVPGAEVSSSSNVSDEDKHKKLLEDVLLNGGDLEALEKIPGFAAMAQEFKAAAEAHTSGGTMWDTMGKKIGDLFGLGGADPTPPPSADEPGAFHASFVSRTPMMSAPAPPATKAPPVTPPQNHYMRSFPGSQFPGAFGNATGGGYDFEGFLPVGGSSQHERSAPPYGHRSPEGPVQTLRSPQSIVMRKKRDLSEDSESEEDRDDSPRRVLMPKRKSTSYQAKSDSREVVDEPDGDGRRKKARKALSEASPGLGGGGKQKFACPYFKRNPRKYRNWTSCPGPGWEEVHRVKTHLYRRHALPLQCPRCWDTFKTDNVLQGHLQMDPPCTIKQNTVPHEGFTKDQEKRLRSRKKAHADMTDEDKWVEIYQILFPDDDPESIPGPYYDTFDDDEGTTPASGSGSGDLDDYSSFVRREMPTLVRRELEALFKTEVGDVEDRLRPKIEQIVLDLQPRLMSLYKQSQIPLSEYGPAQQQPDYGVAPMNMSTPTSTPGLSTGSCGAGLTPNSVISPASMPSPAPVGMLTPESTTSYGGDSVPFYGGFMGANIASMMPNSGMGGTHSLYSTDSALLGTGGGGYDFDASEIGTGAMELNWDDEFNRILDPGVFMPPPGEFAAPVGPVGGYGYRG